MKVSQKQAQLLAQEVIKELRQKRIFTIDPKKRQDVKNWDEKRKALEKKVLEAKDARDKHNELLWNITGKNGRINTYDPIDRIFQKMEEANVPTANEIVDEILLQSMFADEKDMTAFLQKVLKKWDKKKERKTQLN